jgi:hypothetical protein
MRSGLAYDQSMRSRVLTVFAAILAGVAVGSNQRNWPGRVDLEAVTRANGGQFVTADNRATLRLPEVIAIVFDGSDQVIVGGADVKLPDRVTRVGNTWFAPIEFIQALQLKPPPATPEPPAIQGAFSLAWEEFDIGHGVKALQLFERPAPGAPDQASLMLVDFSVLGQADPKLEASVSKFLRDFRTDHPGRALYYSVVADKYATLPESITFVQDGQEYKVEAQAGLLSLEGKFPAESIGVVLLPTSFDIKQPVRVTWGSSTADYVFAH